MIQMRAEERELTITRREAERDATGRATQQTAWFDCPFCGRPIRARVWSLCGSGKRCACEAMFHMRGTRGTARRLVEAEQARNAGVRFVTRETRGSCPGRAEVEVFAPDGQSFDGERHSLVIRGATLAQATEIALADARSTRLADCEADCDCRETD